MVFGLVHPTNKYQGEPSTVRPALLHTDQVSGSIWFSGILPAASFSFWHCCRPACGHLNQGWQQRMLLIHHGWLGFKVKKSMSPAVATSGLTWPKAGELTLQQLFSAYVWPKKKRWGQLKLVFKNFRTFKFQTLFLANICSQFCRCSSSGCNRQEKPRGTAGMATGTCTSICRFMSRMAICKNWDSLNPQILEVHSEICVYIYIYICVCVCFTFWYAALWDGSQLSAELAGNLHLQGPNLGFQLQLLHV